MAPTALVLRHDATIGLGNLEPVLVERGYDLRIVDAVADDLAAVDPVDADVVIVLGGQMGAYERAEHPFLDGEIALLRRRLDAARPIFGVCLGAQLMAAALGAEVRPGPTTEIGYRDVRPTAAGADSPVRHIAGVPMLEWHGDTFDLPEGATLLASSDGYGNEAFAVGGHALAVQFHPEVTERMHERWLVDDAATVARLHLDPDELRAERARHSPGMQDASRAVLSEWLDAVEAR